MVTVGPEEEYRGSLLLQKGQHLLGAVIGRVVPHYDAIRSPIFVLVVERLDELL